MFVDAAVQLAQASKVLLLLVIAGTLLGMAGLALLESDGIDRDDIMKDVAGSGANDGVQDELGADGRGEE